MSVRGDPPAIGPAFCIVQRKVLCRPGGLQILRATFPPVPQPRTLCHWALIPGMELVSFGPLSVNTLPFQALPSPSAWGMLGSPGLALLDSGGLLQGQKGQPGPGSRAQRVWRLCRRSVDSPPPHGKAIPFHDTSKSSVGLWDFTENPVPQTSKHHPPFF